MFFHEFSKVLILQICHHLVQSINLWKQMTRISQHQPIDSWSFLPKTHLLDILEIFRLDMGQISSTLLKKGICNMTACLSFHKHHILRHFCSGMRRNQNLGFRLFDFLIYFFAFPFSLFLFFLLQ